MVSTYLRLTDYNDKALTTTGKYDSSQPITSSIDVNSSQLLKINSFSSDVEQTLSIGSQSTGAGAGRVTFNPFSITKQVDATSSVLFQLAASGTPFKTAEVFLTNQSGAIITRYLFKLVAVKTVAWTASSDSESAMESVSFEYGGLIVTANTQSPDGKLIAGTPMGWNRVRNVLDNDVVLAIK